MAEIIVTAQKRSENIQDVPISVIALSAQQLQDSGVTDIKNLTVLTPGLTVTSTTNENSTTARIRGVGTVGDNPGLESSVGIVIDGVYRPRNGVGFGNLGEIEQIEVLEGPQGELFGKNNDAGVINITTKRPSMTFGAMAEVTGGNFNDREVSASVTGPIGSISAARLYAEYQKRDGWLNIDTGQGPNTNDRANDRNTYTLRGQYLIKPTDDIDILLIGDFSKRNEACCAAVATVLGPFARHYQRARVDSGAGRTSRCRRHRVVRQPLLPRVFEPALGAANSRLRILRAARLESRLRKTHIDHRVARQHHRVRPRHRLYVDRSFV